MLAAAYPDHDLAGIFPLLDSDGLADLAIDIETHGLREPIVLLDNAVLDGRNRIRACGIAGVEPAFTTYTGDDPVAFVASLNLHRRHLTTSQRGVAASKLANLRLGSNQHRGSANLPTLEQPPVSQADAAKLLNVSERTVRTAGVVLEKGEPEIVAAVERGQISVSAAAEISKLPTNLQAIVAERPEDAPAAAKAIRDRDPTPLNGAREAMRPIVEHIIAEMQKAKPKQQKSTKKSVPPLSEPVVPLTTDWPDWTGAIQVIATLPVNFAELARVQPGLRPKVLSFAKRALPRITEWIAALETAHV